MRILIVDDDENRCKSLVAELIAQGRVSESMVSIALCVNDAKRFLTEIFFDVLILDVVLPVRRNDKADGEVGIKFLNEITGRAKYKKPTVVIGITAHLSDVNDYREEFGRHCFTVIEAELGSSLWKEKCSEAIGYHAASRLEKSVSENPMHIVGVHGIRTLGGWQTRLAHLVSSQTSGVVVSAYKYGYFSVFAFFLWFIRNREVRRLEWHFERLFKNEGGASFVIFAHSFGTHLVAHALKRLVLRGVSPPVSQLVFSGSVLPSHFDWSFLDKFGEPNVRVVNDCADADYVLWLSEAFVVGTGMAGKTGFFGVSGRSVVNRYFKGGHSSYFNDDSFMQRYWLPLLNLHEWPQMVDERDPPSLGGVIIEKS